MHVTNICRNHNLTNLFIHSQIHENLFFNTLFQIALDVVDTISKDPCSGFEDQNEIAFPSLLTFFKFQAIKSTVKKVNVCRQKDCNAEFVLDGKLLPLEVQQKHLKN